EKQMRLHTIEGHRGQSKMRKPYFVWIAATTLAVVGLLHAQQPAYDLLLKNGRIVDGTGSPWFHGDVAVRGDTIALIAPHIDDKATRIVDVAGNVIAPGFIDIHTH